jgi:glutamate N-acetyltransferase/amino-acid N-acetyltransferase
MSVTAARGFLATGGSAGIKAGNIPDVALVVAEGSATAAAVFTQNKAPAAPVQLSRSHLASSSGAMKAVLLTSGNANAATGKDGLAAVQALTEAVAASIGCETDQVLICQTGLIGIPFPLSAALPGVADLAGSLDSDEAGSHRAATAIMTTDSFAKEVVIEGDGITVGGIAKGAAMLAPDMATMLAVLTTDAAASPELLSRALTTAIGPSFNSMDIDGATSTNDTVIVLASGVGDEVDEAVLTEMLTEACTSLAEMMVIDAEGATKAVRVTVTGALSDGEAHAAARKVSTSQLVKCSLNGEDPYWGRVLSEVATAGVEMDPERTTISYGGVAVSAGGIAIDHDEAAVAAHMAERWNWISIDLGIGSGAGSILTTDLGYGYIDENRTTS